MKRDVPVLVWLRRDLRLADQPALHAAVGTGRPVVPLFVWSPEEEGDWPLGGASCWWLHDSLAALAAALRERGAALVIRRGPALAALQQVMAETGADTVFWNRLYEPAAVARDTAVKQTLKQAGCTVRSFNGALLREPGTVLNKTGNPFQVFTPFWKHCLKLAEPDAPLPAPQSIAGVAEPLASVPLDELRLKPTIAWDQGFYPVWQPGEAGALAQLDTFCDAAMAGYASGRDIPGVRGTSRLSPHLHFGEVSPRQVWHAAQQAVATEQTPGLAGGAEVFLREIGWRDFAHHLIFHFPHTATQPLRPEFADFPWLEDAEGLRAWQRGQTGYPVVDAGMRELWATGWIHNRVRMIVASFLVKDLLVSWQAGAAWFWDTLVDANLASNTLGWQWAGGCGADAAPYFRIFNPVLQGAKFDPDGAYVRHWVPELKGLPDKLLHQPWTADAGTLRAAGVELGTTYPRPIVDHGEARQRALAALSTIKKN
jgi:deoxyribodipyrimidine photo-lyase